MLYRFSSNPAFSNLTCQVLNRSGGNAAQGYGFASGVSCSLTADPSDWQGLARAVHLNRQLRTGWSAAAPKDARQSHFECSVRRGRLAPPTAAISVSCQIVFTRSDWELYTVRLLDPTTERIPLLPIRVLDSSCRQRAEAAVSTEWLSACGDASDARRAVRQMRRASRERRPSPGREKWIVGVRYDE